MHPGTAFNTDSSKWHNSWRDISFSLFPLHNCVLKVFWSCWKLKQKLLWETYLTARYLSGDYKHWFVYCLPLAAPLWSHFRHLSVKNSFKILNYLQWDGWRLNPLFTYPYLFMYIWGVRQKTPLSSSVKFLTISGTRCTSFASLIKVNYFVFEAIFRCVHVFTGR